MSEKPTIYDGRAPEAELERLKKFEYPNFVSTQLFPNDLRNNRIIDVGAGPNTTLQKIIEQRGGTYVAADINGKFLENRGGGLRVRAAAQELPFENQIFEFAHERFMLMHLSQNERSKVIGEIQRIAHQKLLLEYDWSTWKPTSELQENFIANAYQMATAAHIELNMGALLLSEVKKAVDSAQEKRFSREIDDYYGEIIDLGKAIEQMWRAKLGNNNKADELQNIVHRLSSLKEEEKTPFSPPDIVAVTF